MPTTYNGVGTHYYGSKNKRTRRAVCQQCGRKAQLSSYETRLWFVFLFIPIIPLGRKRITDQCSVCSRHFAIPVKQWETGRQAETAAAMERFRKQQSEETAIDVHGQLIGFQQFEEAAEFRESILERFPDKALLRAGLAAHLEFSGLPEEANEFWDKAQELDPELPEARVGMARRRMREGKLDDARELLNFLEEPGAEKQYSLDPLFDLAGHYQHVGKHESALSIFAVLLQAYPDIANDHQVRNFIRTSEKALKNEESILPQVQHSVTKLFSSQYSSGQRWTVGIIVALVVVAIGAMINNEYIRRHRQLTVFNDTGVPADVQIDGQPPVSVTGMQTLPIAEGSHTIRITGPAEEQHSLTMESGYWDRWTKQPVWIVNVGGEGILADMIVHYAVNPREPTVQLITDPVIVLNHIDYPFEDPPDKLPVSGDSAVVNKTTINWLNPGESDSKNMVGFYTLKSLNLDQAWSWAERRLRRDSGDVGLLRVLVYEVQPAQHPRFQELLETGLGHRPVSIPWHRAYQDIPQVSCDYDRVIQLYADMLNREPDSAELLYLRGRFEKDPATAHDAIRRAVDANPDIAEAWYSLAYRDMAEENWKAVIENLDKAVEKGMRPNEVMAIRHTAMLALQQHEQLEQLLRENLAESPESILTAVLLAEVLIMTDRTDEAKSAMSAAMAEFQSQVGDEFADARHGTAALVAYFQNDLETYISEFSKAPSAADQLAIVRIENGGAADFAASYKDSIESDVPLLPLICSLGFYAAGDHQNARLWQQKQLEHLQTLGPRFDFLRAILAEEKVSTDLIDRLKLVSNTPMFAATILTSLGLRAESAKVRQQFLDAARKLMIRRIPPYGLLRKIHQMADAQS